MAKTVVAMFDSFTDAQDAVQDLVNNGVPREHISVVGNDTSGVTNSSLDDTTTDESAAAEGAGAGAVGGTVVGGVLGLLVGIGALAIPGIGPVLAFGPLLAAVGATAAGAGIGAAAGGLLGALVGAGVPEEDAHMYAEGVRRGSTLVTVTSDGDIASTAYDVLHRHNAVDVDERGQSYRNEGWNRFDETRGTYAEETSGVAGTGTVDAGRSEWAESSKVGTAGGTVAGAATGAAIGSVGGPVGTVIGGIAGAVTGAGVGAAGDAAGEAAKDEAYGEDDSIRPVGQTYNDDVNRSVTATDYNTTRTGDDYASTTGEVGSIGATNTAAGLTGNPSDVNTYDDTTSTARTDYAASREAMNDTAADVGSSYAESNRIGTAGNAGGGAGAATGMPSTSSTSTTTTSTGRGARVRTYDSDAPSSSYSSDVSRTGDAGLDATSAAVRDDTSTAGDDYAESSKVGTATGAVAGAATGAAIGSVGGPVGTVVGGIAGAVTGGGVGAAGDTAGEAAKDSAYGEDDAPVTRIDDDTATGRKGQVDPT